MSTARAIGIDLGGTHIKAVLVDENGKVLRRELRPTGSGVAQGWADIIRTLAQELGDHLPLAISAPGLAAADRRSIAFMPGRLKGLEGFDWSTFLRRPDLVPVINDAHASLLGEAWVGAARGLQNAIMLTLGTGVGGAILSEGRLLRGHLGRAGHLGHSCLDIFGPPSIVGIPGALECWIGNYNIAERSHGKFIDTQDLIRAVRAGDAAAEEVWMRSIRALACAICSFINILDPEAMIIGGGIASAGETLFLPLQKQIDAIEWRPAGHRVKVLPATLGEWAGAIGAAHEAWRGKADDKNGEDAAA